MYRNAITFLFLGLVLYNATSAIWINAAFLLNRGHVVENLCEQRLILDNTCQGQCVLMKKLKESQEKDHEPSAVKVQEMQLVFIQNTWSLDLGTIPVAVTKTPIPRNQLHGTKKFTQIIFRPPIS